MYRKILIPLDGTKFAEQEVEHGLHVTANGGEVILLMVEHTLGLVSFPAEALTSASIQQQFDMEDQRCLEYLRETKDFIKERRPDLTIELVLGHGQVSDAIVKAAEEYQVELVIVAQTHKSLLEKIFSQSTTESVIQRLDKPVLVVHGPPPTRIYQGRIAKDSAGA